MKRTFDLSIESVEKWTVEDYFKACKKVGLRINNLFQTSDGLWQSNVRYDLDEGHMSFEYGAHETPAGAVRRAMLTALKSRRERRR